MIISSRSLYISSPKIGWIRLRYFFYKLEKMESSNILADQDKKVPVYSWGHTNTNTTVQVYLR